MDRHRAGYWGILLVLIVTLVPGGAPRQGRAQSGQERPVIYLYRDEGKGVDQVAPAAWKWDISMLRIDSGCRDKPRAGTSCIRLTYQPLGPPQPAAAEIFWDLAGLLPGEGPEDTLPTGSRLLFWARGSKGGEKAEIQAGGFGPSPRRSSGLITLKRQWRQYEIPLADLEVGGLTPGFCLITILPPQPAKSSLYLDEIRLELGVKPADRQAAVTPAIP